MEMTQDELGLCMVEVVDQIREADPKAHRGRITDAAAYKVAPLAGVRPVDAVRAYRRFRPLPQARHDETRPSVIAAKDMLSWRRGKAPDSTAVEAASVPCAVAQS